MVAAASRIGSKMRPVIAQFCDYHGAQHAIQISGDVTQMYQDVQLAPEDERVRGIYHHKTFCSTCSSYHKAGECRGVRNAETVG